MQMPVVLTSIFGIVIALCVIGLAVLWTELKSLRLQKEHEQSGLRSEVERLRDRETELSDKVNTSIAERASAQARQVELEKIITSITTERDEALASREAALTARHDAETQLAVNAQALGDMEGRLQDWETVKAQGIDAAKAAALTSARELSTQLLADHKRETALAKEDSEARIKATTNGVLDQFQTITTAVSVLREQVQNNNATTQTVLRALSSPGGAGQFAEIGLENTLKNVGLERNRDFFIHPQVEGSSLRPDASVLLPVDTIIVIDCKASKFLLDLAMAEGTESENAAYDNLRRTMRQHLRDLSTKNYKGEIVAAYHEMGRSGEIRFIHNLMYVPNEGAIEKIQNVDETYFSDALRQGISVVGPRGLQAFLGLARMQIDYGRQAENQQSILDEMRQLLDRIGVLVDEGAKIGKGINIASEHYEKFARSYNSRLLPSIRKIGDLGVRSTRSEGAAKTVPVFRTSLINEGGVIEGEVESAPIGDEGAPSGTDQPENLVDRH